ncbi:hypothetical protein DRO53_03745, partial [Candidatus Bathyarchaeota archaeon]
VVEDFITENLAHYRECYVLTRKNSRIYKIASKKPGTRIFLLSPTASKIEKVSEREVIMPVTDPTAVIGFLKNLTKEEKHTAIVFDNLSDFMLLLDAKTTYKFTRHLIDIISDSKLPSLFLINWKTHDSSELASFEALFEVIYK